MNNEREQKLKYKLSDIGKFKAITQVSKPTSNTYAETRATYGLIFHGSLNLFEKVCHLIENDPLGGEIYYHVLAGQNDRLEIKAIPKDK